MGEVIVLGGYGRLGLACSQELAERSRVGIVIAGRSVQKADAAALKLGENVRGAYANASDARTVGTLLRGALAVVCCSGARCAEAVRVSLEHGVPFVGLASPPLARGARAELGERAWNAQVPIVLGAGAVPGIPGVLGEYLVRRVPDIARLRIVTTGPWRGTDRAAQDVATARREAGPLAARAERSTPRRWRFPGTIGSWPVRINPAADLEDFAARHCVGQLTQLEAEFGPVARTLLRLLRRESAPTGFAALAEARGHDAEGEELRVEVLASDPIRVAVASAAILVGAILDRKLPAGLITQREALNPGLFLQELQKRDITVRFFPENEQQD